jgi:hypothetical protein
MYDEKSSFANFAKAVHLDNVIIFYSRYVNKDKLPLLKYVRKHGNFQKDD